MNKLKYGLNRFDRQLWQRFWAIAKLYWFSQEKWQARASLGLLLLLSLSVSGLNVGISYVGRFFQTALADKDAPTFWKFLWIMLLFL
jgi:putative ATP-binding cassette transporter